jgi:hypothetical protein
MAGVTRCHHGRTSQRFCTPARALSKFGTQTIPKKEAIGCVPDFIVSVVGTAAQSPAHRSSLRQSCGQRVLTSALPKELNLKLHAT